MNSTDRLFYALSDENRQEILKQLLQGKNCPCMLLRDLPISQPTLSYHLKTLTECGITTTERHKNWKRHYVDLQKIDEMIAFLESLKEIREVACDC